MSELPGIITTYRPDMAEAVARMFNAFSELWPGGFGGGIPYDANRVHDFLDKTSAVADLIALDEASEPVGYCGLYPHWRDADAAFITILGVTPPVKGHKFGRRLLLRAIEIAAQKGYRRVDLGTWPGNLDAVPLYKKTGLFWVPETNVYMMNFIPGLTQIRFAQAWFDKHPDWYACFQRELTQAPDDETEGGMAVYTYRFQAGEDSLVGQVDRYAMGVCALESVLDGKKIALRTRLADHNILIGIPNSLTIRIENGTPSDLPVTLDIEAFKGQQWQESFPHSLIVPAGQNIELSRMFIIDHTAQIYRSLEASAAIRTRLILEEQVVELVTGGKIQPAVELRCQQGYQIVQSGNLTQVYLDVKNNSNQVLHGSLEVLVEGLPVSQQNLSFLLQAGEITGVILPVEIPAAHPETISMHARPIIQAGNSSIEMPEFRFPLVVDHAELNAVALENKGNIIHLLTDLVDVRIELEGGDISLGSRTLQGMRRPANFEAGPPYGISLDRTLLYTYVIHKDGPVLTLQLSAESRQFPGLHIQKHLRAVPGRKEIEQRVILTNLNRSNSLAIGGRMNTGGFGGISLNAYGTPALSFSPLDGSVVTCDAQLPLMNDNMLPQNPERWPESWTALKTLARDDLAAFFWQPDGVSKIKLRSGMLNSLENATRILHPNETHQIFQLWYGFGYSSPEEVRHRWNQLVGRKELLHSEVARLETIPPVQARWVEDNILRRGELNKRQIELSFVSTYSLAGQLNLKLPEGWQATFESENGLSETIPMPEPIPESPQVLHITLIIPEGETSVAATPVLHLSGEFEMDFPLPVLLASDQSVQVQKQIVDDRPVYIVSNGALQFIVMADIGGNLLRLQDRIGRTYLDDNFPQVQPRFFLPYHIGGLQPFYFSIDAEQSFTAPETVFAQPMVEAAWQGVQVTWTAENQPELRGQRFTLAYLTLSGSELVRIRMTHTNATSRRMEWVGGFFANVAFDGSMDGIAIHSPGGTQVWRRNHVPQPFTGLTNLRQPWTLFSRDRQSLLLTGLPRTSSQMTALDYNQILGGLMAAVQQTEPHSAITVEFVMAVNQPPEMAMELIAAL